MIGIDNWNTFRYIGFSKKWIRLIGIGVKFQLQRQFVPSPPVDFINVSAAPSRTYWQMIIIYLSIVFLLSLGKACLTQAISHFLVISIHPHLPKMNHCLSWFYNRILIISVICFRLTWLTEKWLIIMRELIYIMLWTSFVFFPFLQLCM